MRNRYFYEIIVLSLLNIICVRPDTNNYLLTVLSSNEGLSQQDVECILQDKYGFIWIGTYDGLNRYDGNEFTVFRYIPDNFNTISDNRILSLAEIPDRDELWIGTDGGGLNCYNLRTTRFRHFPGFPGKENALTDNQISALYKSVNNELWVGTANGPHQISFTTDDEVKFSHYSLNNPGGEKEPLQHVITLSEDLFGNMIAGTPEGLYIKNKSEKEFDAVYGIDKNIRQVQKDLAGNLWILTDSKIYYYSMSTQRMQHYLSHPYILPDLPAAKSYRKILPVSENFFILITDDKVFRIKQDYNNFSFEEIFFPGNTFLENNQLKSLLLDRSMNIWLTSRMDGVARFDLNAKSISPYPINHPLAKDKIFIQTLEKDRYGRFWIGTGNGVFIEDPISHTTHHLQGIDDLVFSILEDNRGDMWMTSTNNLHFIPGGRIHEIKNAKDAFRLPEGIFPFDGPYAICYDPKREIIWIGFRSGILQVKYQDGNYIFNMKRIFPHEALRVINNATVIYYEQKQNSLLIGTKNAGLVEARLNEDGDIIRVKHVNHPHENKEEHIWAIYHASDDFIYIGTDCGLKKARYDENNNLILTTAGEDIRLKTYKIASIVEDNKKNLWLNTTMGLLRYSLTDGELLHYLNTDGLVTNNLCEGAFYDSKTNLLYVGSVKGINVIDLTSLYNNNIAPEVHFTSLKINNTTVQPQEKYNGRKILISSIESTEKISLKHHENNFTIEFAALHFSNPAKNNFAYLLEGFGNEWAEVNNNIRSATFTNIPPGNYRLLVKSSNGDKVWNETPATLFIAIRPAFWQTGWAYFLYLILFVTILYFIYKYVHDRNEIKREFLLKQLQHTKEMEIAEVKLKYHTNITHEFRTPLSLIIAPVQELLRKEYDPDFFTGQLHIINNNADRLMMLVNQMLDFRKVVNEKYTLHIRYENIQLVLHEIRDYFSGIAGEKNITIEFFNELNGPGCWCDKEVIIKICSNLLSNAIKFTDPYGKVYMYASFNQDNSKLEISVEDTGIGISEEEAEKIFTRFYQVPGSTGGTGIGLSLCKQLAQIHGGDVMLKSHPGEGSVFTLTLPVARTAFPESTICEANTLDNRSIPEELEEENEEVVLEEEHKPVILVVEDNYELRDYLIRTLKDGASLLSAANGEEGLKLAIQHIPDLILSDIMMPVMNGIELIRKCREDIRTSHIPFIMLTAKETQESEIEGLEYGAEDYIKKPFNVQILKLRIKNLLRLTYQKKEEATNERDKMNERERQFLEYFEKIVIDNISKPEFNIDDVCRIMYISRMQLYRKITSLINKKPADYMKEIKMKKAYELMKEKGFNVTEAMMEVGYTNFTYFARRFKTVNGILPREVLGMQTGKK